MTADDDKKDDFVPEACLTPEFCFRFDLFDTPVKRENEAPVNEEMHRGLFYPDIDVLKSGE